MQVEEREIKIERERERESWDSIMGLNLTTLGS